MRTFEELCHLIGAVKPSAGFIRVPDCRISELRAKLGEPATVHVGERYVVVTYKVPDGAALIIGTRAEEADDDRITDAWIVRT